MREEDRFDFFLRRAISEPNENPEFIYYFFESKKVLIRQKINQPLGFDIEVLKELPKLSFKKKKKFLMLFIDKQDLEIKNKAHDIINNFTESSSFDLINDFKLINKDLAIAFFFEGGKFLHDQIQKIYSDFDLYCGMEIQW